MKYRVGLSQRIDEESRYKERREGLDQNWAKYLRKLSSVPIPLMSGAGDSTEEYLNTLKLDLIILTGGNDIEGHSDASNLAPERDQFERSVIEYSQIVGIPLIGVCRGLQFLNMNYAGRLSQVADHVATRHQVQLNEEFFGLGEREVNSFHNFGIKDGDLGVDLEPLATAQDGTIEAFKHKIFPHFAVMWHPEREATFDENDLQWIRKIINSI